jgi:putative transposase
MRRHLKRYYGYGHLHFITFSCHQRRPLFSEPNRRDLFLQILEQVRRKYRFVVVGYVVMPEHVHLLINEPKVGTPSTVIQVLKQRTSRAIRHDGKQFWQLRFYDFNVWSTVKHIEKLDYMHRNPVTRGLVAAPENWRWSNYRSYAFKETGSVGVNEGWEVFPGTQEVQEV